MMYIDRNRIQVLNQNWIQKTQALTEELRKCNTNSEREIIIDKGHRYWKLFKDQLKRISYNKCWYSETKNPFSHYHVDHFRPKKKVLEFDGQTERDGYWWLTFEPTNYRLSGSVGNTKKGNHFAVNHNKVTEEGPIDDEGYYLLDPTNQNDVHLLNFRQDGLAVESCPEDEDDWLFNRAKYSIDVLDLNYPDLVEVRQQKWVEVDLLIKKVEKARGEYNKAKTATKKADVDHAKNEIRKLLAPCSELTSTVRACIRSTGKDWAYRLLEEQIQITEYCTENG